MLVNIISCSYLEILKQFHEHLNLQKQYHIDVTIAYLLKALIKNSFKIYLMNTLCKKNHIASLWNTLYQDNWKRWVGINFIF
jgi:hypothetical protein